MIKNFMKTRDFRALMMLVWIFYIILVGKITEKPVSELSLMKNTLITIAHFSTTSGVIGLISKELIFLMPAGGIHKENDDKRARLIKTINVVLIILGFLSLIAFFIIHYLF